MERQQTFVKLYIIGNDYCYLEDSGGFGTSNNSSNTIILVKDDSTGYYQIWGQSHTNNSNWLCLSAQVGGWGQPMSKVITVNQQPTTFHSDEKAWWSLEKQ